MKWTNNNVEEIKELLTKGKTIKEIAFIVNRNYDAVSAKMKRCGIKYYDYNSKYKLSQKICPTCGIKFQRTRKKQIFCSQKCCNIELSKLKLKGNCFTCGRKISSSRKYCKKCKIENSEILDNMLLKDVIYENHHKSSAFALVRSRARSKAKKLGMTKCSYCGYDKHVEIAHIIPISNFSLDTKIKIINHKNNIIPLCPNHHWEFDNGLIQLGN